MTSWDRRCIIGVMGGADPALPCETLGQAEKTGRLIAEAGAVLLSGGRTGVMEAAARGAKSIPRGETLAVLPGSDRDGANPFIDWVVATGMGNGRNIVNVLSSDVVIAFPGGAGTLSEIALALKTGTPVIALPPKDLKSCLTEAEAGRLYGAATPEEAVSLALRLARRPSLEADTLKAEVLKLLSARAKAIVKKDPDAYLGFWLDAPQVCLTWDGRVYLGKEAIRSWSETASVMEVSGEGLRIIPFPGRAGAATFSCRLRHQDSTQEEWCGTVFLLWRDKSFRIAVEHLSPARNL